MINATLVKINREPEDKPETLSLAHTDMDIDTKQARDLEWEFKPLKKTTFSKQISALSYFQQWLNSKVKKLDRLEYGLMLHKRSEVESEAQVGLIYMSDKKTIELLQINNPLYKQIAGVRRNVEYKAWIADVSPAMQSQLFAMLDSSNGDAKWINSFQLKDRQQENMYAWQKEHFPQRNEMTPIEMRNMMANVIRVARLPWINLDFKDEGNSCMFALTQANGQTLTVDKQGDNGPNDMWTWLSRPDEGSFEKLGEINDGYRLRVSDMRLIFITKWAMSAPILLHELAHYIQFMMPTPYRMNKGDRKLNYNEYEEIFCGHGAAYMAVFSRLLIDFHYIDEEELYDSIRTAGLNWFPIKGLSPNDMTDGISDYCKKFDD